MPRARDLGITIGSLPTGPTSSVLDVAGVGLGHATVWRDEPDPPEGRGIARTGVTCLLLAEDAFHRPLPAGGAVLNGAGECTGFITAAEWGSAETPVYLTSTLQLGRVYDAACRIELERTPQVADDFIIPVVAECDDSFLNDARTMQVDYDDVVAAHAAALASRRLVDAARRGSRRVGHRHVLLRLQGRHRHRLPGDPAGLHRRGAADDQLRGPRGVRRRRRTGRTAAAALGLGPARPRRLVHRRRGDRRARGRRLLRPAGATGRDSDWPAPARSPITAAARSSSA